MRQAHVQKDVRRRLRQQKNEDFNVLSNTISPEASNYEALVLTLDSYWQPHKWISVEDAIVLETKGLVQSHVGNTLFMYRGGINAKSQERSKVETSTIIAINGASKQKLRKIPLLSNRVLFRRDQHVCAYCGNIFKDSSLTRDHIVPVSRGGTDEWMNVVTACFSCNNKKGDSLLKEIKLQLLYIPYVPCAYENMLLQNRRILADQMAFLVAGIKNKHSRALLQ